MSFLNATIRGHQIILSLSYAKKVACVAMMHHPNPHHTTAGQNTHSLLVGGVDNCRWC